MSLIKQIRIAISVIIMMVVAGCLSLSVFDNHRFMAEQLQKKNNDNANGLAITLSNIPKDPITVELIVSAQFDMGHYHRIAIISPEKKPMIERRNLDAQSNAPQWFQHLFSINIAPGVASIQSGWQQYGTLIMESEPSLAYDQLWQTTQHALLWTLLVAFVSYVLSGLWLKKILTPLDQVIAQAVALGEREYITIPEPKTPEFQKLVRTMNTLSGRIKHIVTEASQSLSVFNQQINFDEVTGLMNQSHFANSASVALKSDNYVDGALVLIQLRNLADIDRQLGYSVTNQLIKKIADALNQHCQHYPHMIAGRLAGGLFGLFSRQPLDDNQLATEVKWALEKLNVSQSLVQLQFVLSHTKARKGDDFSDMFKVMQFIFELANDQAAMPVRVMNANSIVTSRKHFLSQWRDQFMQAIEHKQIKLARYPVQRMDQHILHYEAPLRLRASAADEWMAAGAFIDWAQQLDMMETLDTLALEYAVDLLHHTPIQLSINVSAAAMRSEHYCDKLRGLVTSLATPAAIGFEITEETAFADFVIFKQFVQLVKSLGCMVGIEHVANRLGQLGDLHELGLDFVKFDASLIRDIHLRNQQQSLLRGLCMMVRTMGIMPIAEGVLNIDELESLRLIGVDAVTGPFIHEALNADDH